MRFEVRLTLLAVAALAATIAVAAPRVPAGECGAYLYWHHGKCADARTKKSPTTWSNETLSKQWKP